MGFLLETVLCHILVLFVVFARHGLLAIMWCLPNYLDVVDKLREFLKIRRDSYGSHEEEISDLIRRPTGGEGG
ncbi:hypothetical protein GQ457_09G009730 [Hibiscus cannabinus]